MSIKRNDKTGSICAALNGQSMAISMWLYDMRTDEEFMSAEVSDTTDEHGDFLPWYSAHVTDVNGTRHNVSDLGPCSANDLFTHIVDALY